MAFFIKYELPAQQFPCYVGPFASEFDAAEHGIDMVVLSGVDKPTNIVPGPIVGPHRLCSPAADRRLTDFEDFLIIEG